MQGRFSMPQPGLASDPGPDPSEEFGRDGRRSKIPIRIFPMKFLRSKTLVRAKKARRDKDWPMIRRLVEAQVP
jgi:hypothetical protein